MAMRDPYRHDVAFDDVVGGGGYGSAPSDLIDMSGAVKRALRQRRFGSPVAQVIEHAPYDTTEWSFTPGTLAVIGADADIPKGKYPLFDKLRSFFKSGIGDPKLVRVDDEETYAVFRSVRRQPHMSALDERLSKLERQVAEHVADQHGGGRLERLEEAFAAHLAHGDLSDAWLAYDANQAPFDFEYDRQVIGAIVDAARGGQRVPLDLPPAARGKAECWLDGDEVLLSVRTPVGIVTTGCPVDSMFEEAVGCGEAVGCCGLEVLLIGAYVAPIEAGQRLLGAIARITPAIETVKPPAVLVARPNAVIGTAAAMGLLQRAQKRDRRALREAHEMAHGEGRDLIVDAADRLTRGQREKAQVAL